MCLAAKSLLDDYLGDHFADGPIEGTAKVALDIFSLFTLRNISKSAPQKFDAALCEEFGVYGKASARNLHARLNQVPYNPRNAQSLATELLGSSEFTSSTIPGQSMPNVRLAGQCKERTIVINPETQETLPELVVI